MPGGPVAIDHSDSQAGSQGHWAGRWRSSRRAVAAMHAGMLMTWRRRAAHLDLGWLAATLVARARLNALAASATQAAFAVYFPEGRCASGPSLSSAMTCSTKAWSR